MGLKIRGKSFLKILNFYQNVFVEALEFYDYYYYYYYYYFFLLALQPNAGYGLLIHEVFSRSHTTTHHSR